MLPYCVGCGERITMDEIADGEAGPLDESGGEYIHEDCRADYRDAEAAANRPGYERPAKDPNYHTGFDQLAEPGDDARDGRGL